MRKLLLVCAIVVVVAIGYLFVTLESQVSRQVEALNATIAEETKLVSDLGDIEVGLLPRPSIDIDGVTLRADKRTGGRPVAHAARVRIVPRLAPLLFGETEVSQIVIEDVDLYVRRDPRETATALLGALSAERSIPVSLSNARIHVETGPGRDDAAVGPVTLRAEPPDEDGRVAFSAAGAAVGESSRLALSGSWKPGAGRTGGAALAFEVRLDDADPVALAALIPHSERAGFEAPLVLEGAAEGFVGERSTESAPAAPLSGTLEGTVGFNLYGVREPLAFTAGFSIDDKRWMLREGKGKWGEQPLTFSGWSGRGKFGNKVGGRLELDQLHLASVLAAYGIPERWRAHATAKGRVRVFTSNDDTLYRWEASAPTVRFDGWASHPIVTGPMTVQGSLFASNADASGSFRSDEVKIGKIRVEKFLAGVTFFRDKLTVTSLDLPVWDGKFSGAVSYFPKEEKRVEAGAVFRDMDASVLREQFLPDVGLDLSGRVNAVLDLDFEDDGAWARGRAEVRDGTLGPPSLTRDAVVAVARAAERPGAVSELADVRPDLIDAEKLPFELLVLDFERRSGKVTVRVDELASEGAMLKGEGTVGRDGALDGWATLALSEEVTADVAAAIPAAGMLAGGRELRIPLRIEGTSSKPRTVLSEELERAVARAAAGETVGRFAPAEPELALELDLPPLEDTFPR